MTTAPLSEAETNAYLGDLLYHTHEYDDAEKYLKNALALDTGSVMANTSYGLVKMRQRKFAEAKNFLEKASGERREKSLRTIQLRIRTEPRRYGRKRDGIWDLRRKKPS